MILYREPYFLENHPSQIIRNSVATNPNMVSDIWSAIIFGFIILWLSGLAFLLFLQSQKARSLY